MNSLNREVLSVKCAHIHRGFKNGSRGSLDTKPVGTGGGGCQALSCEDVGVCGENTALFQLSSISFPM